MSRFAQNLKSFPTASITLCHIDSIESRETLKYLIQQTFLHVCVAVVIRLIGKNFRKFTGPIKFLITSGYFVTR